MNRKRTWNILTSLLIAAGLGLLTSGCSDSTTPSTTTAKANAGADAKVLVGDVTTLSGLSSTGVTTSKWTLTSVPTGSAVTLSADTTLQPKFTPDKVGDYEVELNVNDGASKDVVVITAKNVIAAITNGTGSAITTRTRFGPTEWVIDLGKAGAALSASTSRGHAVSYKWEQVSGPSATGGSGETTAEFEFTAPTFANFLDASQQFKWQPMAISTGNTFMTLKLTVTDEDGHTDAATQKVYLADDGSVIHTASGLPNVGVNGIVYLQGPTLRATSGASVTLANYLWTLTPPAGSSAKFNDTGTTSSASQFPSFTPDVVGLYSVAYSTTTGGALSGTILINAAEYSGVGTVAGASPRSPQCGTCHNGSIEEDAVTKWTATKHAQSFSSSMATYAALAPEPYLWEIETVGYNTDAPNHGFDDVLSDAQYTFPSTVQTFAHFAEAQPELASLSGVQCENCHGPGSQHAGDPLRIAASFSQPGTCGQCHLQNAEWANSGHNSTGVKHGAGRYQSSWLSTAGCTRCHAAKGFAAYVEEGEEGLAPITPSTDTGAFVGITCAACHDPHDSTNSHQLRTVGNVTMVTDGSTVNAGKAATCYTCHDGLYEFGEKSCDFDENGVVNSSDTNAGKCESVEDQAVYYFRQAHPNTQSPVLEGKGALTAINDGTTPDFTLTENSFHSGSNFTLAGVTGNSTLPSSNDKCVTCHMSTAPSADEEGYQKLGGHSFKMVTEGDVEHLSACTSCHPSVTEFDRTARADYDGDGNLEGVQDEITGLLCVLSQKLKAIDAAAAAPNNLSVTAGVLPSDAAAPYTVAKCDTGTITYAEPPSLGWAGQKSSLPTGKNCASSPIDVGTSCDSNTRQCTVDDYQPCNFVEGSKALRRALWNYNLIANDGSFGIHNAAFAVQLLQKTYTTISTANGGSSFATDRTKATLR